MRAVHKMKAPELHQKMLTARKAKKILPRLKISDMRAITINTSD